MLSLAQSFNSIFCIEWIPSGSGPKVLKYKKIKPSFNCSTYKNFLDSILSDFNISSINDSNALALSLDIDNVGLASFKYDDNILFEDYTQWYEEKVLGSYITDNYDIYYYQLYNVNNIAMVVYINKELKKNIIESCNKNNLEVQHLGIDIFSANISVNQIYKTKKIKSYMIWKIHRNNIHYITYYENNKLKHYLKIRAGKDINVLQYIGMEDFQNKLVNFIDSLIFKRKNIIYFVENIYVYQTKSDTSFIKQYHKNKKIKIMDVGSKFLNRNKKNINYSILGFNENGNSLKGIDV